MEFVVDVKSPLPPFEQLRAQIAEGAKTERLIAGTRLPPVRQLAAELGIAANTVARAYRELEAAGIIETRGRNGTVIAASGDATRALAHDAAREYARRIAELGLSTEDGREIVLAALNA